ncbi:hypothetical protein TTHERM_00298270 (macronuclear) [Tetrahymena thermophila SB210]|uniref:UvrD-like helicase ATP-binding domain-containing protein n=1 Tax=Tetrahymena thermophila (strain SB210) TaxID=312017 RepID=I7MAA5_TETTS|nr:hypothetical protein TTHERM_00298270 [Tetrahymena thermophila SB210]EAS04216.2 hypothetical protein TTHERM_00298270 [Tetrahymena thermophila SB210]|eukprot:XP_001024461.2 hypothetical protein TTHERM_00298270 [Tetrahymena thermophila SB210]
MDQADIKKLEQKYLRYQSELKQKAGLTLEDTQSFIIKWLESYNSYIEDYFLPGKINKFPDEQKMIINNPLINSTWNWRVHKNFISKLNQLQLSQIYKIISNMEDICQGNFSHLKRIKFYTSITLHLTEFIIERDSIPGINMLVMVGVEKIPTLDRNFKKVERFDFKQFIMFLNLIQDGEKIDGQYINKKYQDILNDPCRSGFIINPMQTNPKGHNQFFFQKFTETVGQGKLQFKRDVIRSVLQEDLEFQKPIKYEPFLFEYHVISQEYQYIYIFSKKLNRWATQYFLRRTQVQDERNGRVWRNNALINNYSDFQSASVLVDLLKNVTNLNIKLTDEERNAIGSEGNTIVIGRSGTGKTTCALLRLFTFELVFRMRVKIKYKENKKILQDALTNQPIGLQSVFVTTSPVLANKIQKYYNQFISNIKEQVRIKQKQKQEEEQKSNQIQQNEQQKINDQNLIAQNIQNLTNSINKNNDLDTTFEKVDIQNMVESEIEQFKIDEDQRNTNDQQDSEIDCGDDEFEDEQESQNFVLSEQATKHKSLKELQSSDFPAFFTVRQYLMLIEGCLLNPFFYRDQQGKIANQEGQSSWNNYKSEKQKKQLKITTKNKEDDDIKQFTKNNVEDFTFLLTHRKAEEKVLINDQEPHERRFEVDYQYFENIFWPVASIKFRDSSMINCYTLWTEIYYNIKGHQSFSIIDQHNYVESELNNLLSKQQKEVVYSMFKYYEAWKIKQQGYDLMDLVLFIEREIHNFNFDIPSIHLTMIDEVQDLPLKIIQIFRSINEHSIFFGGDSAQSIARGVGFKFDDLKQSSTDQTHQLTTNFRSHNNILQLSNSVISLLEGLFPTSIDILKKERSNLKGIKPIVLDNGDISFLFNLLQGQQSDQGFVPLDFGCNQVIIVKDDESKQKLPPILEHAICLTIKEAKGLEFDDVVLFDFFSDSKSSIGQWDCVKLLDINQEVLSRDLFLKRITQHNVENQVKVEDMDELTFETTYGVEYDKEKDEVTLHNVITKNEQLRAFDRVGNSLLCQELKQLYTAITRPKQRLIIFDQSNLKRKEMQTFWEAQNLVTIISSQDLEDSENIESPEVKLTKREQFIKAEKDQTIKLLQKLLVKNTKEEWYQQGLKMFKHKYFEQAVKCFKKSGHFNHEKKAQAYFEATNISNEVMKIDNELSLLKQGIGQYMTLKGKAKTDLRTQLLNQLKEKKKSFIQVGETFLSINRKKQAAQCFFSAEQFEKAGELYQQINQIREAAESYFLSKKNHLKAALLYEEAQDFDKAITALEQDNQWIQILSLIQRNQDKFNPEDIEKLKEKYVTLAFQNIRSLIEKSEKQNQKQVINDTIQEGESDDSISSFNSNFSDNEEEIIEEKDNEEQETFQNNSNQILDENNQSIQNEQMEQIKQQKSQQASQKLKNYLKDKRIFEKDEQEPGLKEEEEEEEIEEKQQNDLSKVKGKLSSQMKKLKQQKNQEQSNQEKIDKDETISQQSESISIIDDKNKLKKSLENSFSVIEKESNIDLSDISFENFSEFDPLDQLLKKQISQSIVSVANTEFSILDSSHMDQQQKGLLIQTKEEINISDQALVCVLEVASLIDSQVMELVSNFIKRNIDQEIVLNESNRFASHLTGIEQVDLNKLDENLIEKVLDVLNKYFQPSIELQICNRYKIFQRISKIIPLLTVKHSPISQVNSLVQQTQMISQLSYLKKKQKEQALIANAGLHTILESISPEYFNNQVVNVFDQVKEPSFSQECFKQLILQGYWKRILYLMDKKDALDVASAFCDFTSFYDILLEKKYLFDKDRFSFYDLQSFSSQEIESIDINLLARIQMEDFNYQMISKGFNNQKFYQNAEIPNCFKYHRAIWYRFFGRLNQNHNDQKTLQELLEDGNKIILGENNSDFSELQIFDTISSLNLVLLYNSQLKFFQNLPAKMLSQFTDIFNKLKQFLKNYNNISDKKSLRIAQAILSAYQIRLLSNESDRVLSILGKNKVILHKSNLLVYSLLKNYKQVDEQDLISYCDVEFEFIQAPLNVILLLINRKIQPLLDSIQGISTANEGSLQSLIQVKDNKHQVKNEHAKRIYSDQDYYDFYLKDEVQGEGQMKNITNILIISHKDEIFQKLEEKQQLLVYGLTEDYNEMLFNSYKKLLIEELNQQLYEQILANLIINYEENKQIKLLIPQQDITFYKILSLNQSILYQYDHEQDGVLKFNLESYQNFEDIDEICQNILKSVKFADRKEQLFLFKMIFTLLINVNEIEFESLNDLISALKLLDWSPEINDFLSQNEFYQGLLDIQTVEEAKDFAYDFSLTEEFETIFFKWEEINIINKSNQDQNLKKYREDKKYFESSFELKNQKIKIIQRFLKNNKDQLDYIYRSSLNFKHLSDYYNIQDEISRKNFVSQFKYCLIAIEEAANSFELIKQIEKDIQKIYYYQHFVGAELFSLITKSYLKTQDYFQELSQLFNEQVNLALDKKFRKYKKYQEFLNIYERVKEFNITFRAQLNQILIKLNGENQQKKKQISLSQQLKPTDQKVLKLMKKKRNAEKLQMATFKKEVGGLAKMKNLMFY